MGRFDALTQLDEKQEEKTSRKLNSDATVNGLKVSAVNPLDGSALVSAKKHSPTPLPETRLYKKEQSNTPERANAQTPVLRPVRGTVPPPVPLIPKVKRLIRQRQPFDIYEDQYERLKRIAGSEREFVNGRGMSQMVREAIDNYFRDYCSSKE